MTFTTYELYYLDTYDQEAADLIEDFDYDEDDVAYELDSEYVIDNGVRVCVIVHDLRTHEVEIAMLQPGSPQAPGWYSAEDAAYIMKNASKVIVVPGKIVNIVGV